MYFMKVIPRLWTAIESGFRLFAEFALFCWENILLLAILLALVAFATYCLYLVHVHKKYDHIPGPKREGFFTGNIGGITEEVENGGFFANYLLKCIKKYGMTFRLNFFHETMVFTADPTAIRDLMVTGHHPKSAMISNTTRSLFGVRFLGDSFVTEFDIKKAAWKRSLLTPCFQTSYLRNMMSDFNQVADTLISRLQHFADGVSPVTMLDEFNKLSLDTLAKTAFGIELDSLNEANNPFTKSITTVLKGFTMKAREPFLTFNPKHWKFIWDVRKAIKFLRYFGNNLLKKRHEKMERGDYVPDDILTHIVKIKDANPDLNNEEILDDFLAFFIAGQETIASTLSFLLLEVGKNKDIYQRLQKEIDDKVGKKRVLEYADLMQLNYTDMVLKETLRLFPPAANTFREVQTEHEIGGYVLPAHTTVGMSMFSSGRLEEFFPDPLKFDPDRFSKHPDNKVNTYTYFPFTLGPRTCLGKQFADIEGKVIVAKIFQNFNYSLDMTQSFEIDEVMLLKPKGKSRCVFTMR